MNASVRAGLIVVALAIVGWFAYEIYRAGGDMPPTSTNTSTLLKAGHAEGRRLTLPSWSLDYDKITTSNDNSLATLENVHDGRYYKNGKPFMKMKAAHVVVNTITNDFTVTGPIELVEIDGKHDRRFTSDAAIYTGFVQTLTLNRPATIVSDGATLRVKTATFNFKSGDIRLGPFVGTK
ncbi:MAG: hypothetical protein NVSMB64_23680 [Candidatus Velthaea sp.]